MTASGGRALVMGVLAAVLMTGCAAAPEAIAPAPDRPAYGPAAPDPAPALNSGAAPPGLAAPVAPPGQAPAGPQADPLAPLSLEIPGIGVATGPLLALGLDAAGGLEVPPDATGTGWYVYSPVPGDVGPSVIAAHVDFDGRPGVFARLAELGPGAVVTVRRADGADVRFVVDRVERYAKADFPSATVYGNTPGPELRLITCGGAFNDGTGHYDDNVVAFAHQV